MGLNYKIAKDDSNTAEDPTLGLRTLFSVEGSGTYDNLHDVTIKISVLPQTTDDGYVEDFNGSSVAPNPYNIWITFIGPANTQGITFTSHTADNPNGLADDGVTNLGAVNDSENKMFYVSTAGLTTNVSETSHPTDGHLDSSFITFRTVINNVFLATLYGQGMVEDVWLTNWGVNIKWSTTNNGVTTDTTHWLGEEFNYGPNLAATARLIDNQGVAQSSISGLSGGTAGSLTINVGENNGALLDTSCDLLVEGKAYVPGEPRQWTRNSVSGLENPVYIGKNLRTAYYVHSHHNTPGVVLPSSGDYFTKVKAVGNNITAHAGITCVNIEGDSFTVNLQEGDVLEGPFKSVELIDNTGANPGTGTATPEISLWEGRN
jgi:hypothetical protein